MSTHLSRILDGVRETLAERKSKVSLETLKEMAGGRKKARESLSTVPSTPAVIAEIKRASPSRGWICPDANAAERAGAYLSGGAWAISILTEERLFGGSLSDLAQVREAYPHAILLRKDFLLDEYMVAESKAYGADLALLMVSVLGDQTAEMISFAREYGIEPLVEIHDERELDIAAGAKARLIGINNRNLSTLVVDLAVSERLLPLVPKKAISVVESGISKPEQVSRFHQMGARLFLVGESLMDSGDPADTIRRYVGK
ncbi:MAG: indole-3-glycerol phosphate synthase TrpC [Syntrophorhabdaceae bacterium]|nr:indole-3-glycerol phosphate synthase TrpC [Syntrophorhabdaceae bacterium]